MAFPQISRASRLKLVISALAISLAAGAVLPGCATSGIIDGARGGPFFKPTNFFGDTSLGGIRRVVVLPVWSGDVAPVETAAQLDPIVITALQQAQRFEVVAYSRADFRRRFAGETYGSAAALPHNFIDVLKHEFGADAVLFTDLTVFRSQSPLALGLRSKLATLENTRLVWTFDTVFSADNPAVANSARHHFLESDQRVPIDLTRGVLQSPSRFAAYASSAMFATLPPVIAPVVKATKSGPNSLQR